MATQVDSSDQPSARAWALPDSPSGDAAALAAVPPVDPSAIDGVPVDEGSGAVEDASAEPAGPPRLPVPLRPMTVSDVLDGAFAIIKARPGTVVLVAAAIAVPAQLLGAFLARGQTSIVDLLTVIGDPTVAGTGPASGLGILGVYAGAILEALSFFFLGGALGRLVSAWYAGGDLTAGAALKASFRRTPAFLAAFFGLLPLKVGAYAACFLPALVVITFFSLTAPVMVIEDLGPWNGVKRSATLVARRFWRCLWIITLSTIVSQIIGPLLALIPEVVSFLVPEGYRWVLQGVGRAAVSLLLAPFAVGVCILLYLDLRVRTEGLDIDLDAAAAFAEPR